jgi:hypothetical protein
MRPSATFFLFVPGGTGQYVFDYAFAFPPGYHTTFHYCGSAARDKRYPDPTFQGGETPYSLGLSLIGRLKTRRWHSRGKHHASVI